MFFWLGVQYFAVTLLNRAAELAGLKHMKLIKLLRPTSLCHSGLSLNSLVYRRENCLVTTLHFRFNPLTLLRVTHVWCICKDSQQIVALRLIDRQNFILVSYM